MKISAARIRKLAIRKGIHPRIEFLASEQVACEVADRVWAYLKEKGYESKGRDRLVKVSPSSTYEGTWCVELLRGVKTSHTGPVMEGAIKKDDLVKSWPL